ncbi:hypothetical protein [Clostridium sp. 1001271B_151109_B4]|uniref:hypothetical protein n=1 Tax=Clostridium sp. 1001271B_151109_B4 TaxID=2787148 RepID=UPI0018A90499|nr:hypothetical protein [Clostridium sp. 1001271B_151109_B4]
MALTKAFYEAVNSGNVRRVRIMMKNSFLVDPSFTEFKEMEKVAASMQGLYDAHDGRGFEENQDNWDDNYMDKQMVKLISNFSHERISHVKDVVRHLRPVCAVAGTTQQISNTRTNYSIKSTHMSYEEKKSQDQRDGRYLRAKVATGAVTGAVAGAVVGGIVASTASVSVVGGALVGAALGAVVGGVVVAVVAKGGN